MSTGGSSDSIVISKNDIVRYFIFAALLAIVGFFAYRAGGDQIAQPRRVVSTHQCGPDCGPSCPCNRRRLPFYPGGDLPEAIGPETKATVK